MPEVSGVIRCFRPFPLQLTCAPDPRWTSARRQAGQFRRPKTGLDSEAEQCGVAPPGPVRPIGRGEQGIDFRLGQESHEPSLEALWWNGKNALDRQKHALDAEAPRIGTGNGWQQAAHCGCARCSFSAVPSRRGRRRPAKHQDRRYPASLGALSFLSDAKTSNSRRVSRYAQRCIGTDLTLADRRSVKNACKVVASAVMRHLQGGAQTDRRPAPAIPVRLTDTSRCWQGRHGRDRLTRSPCGSPARLPCSHQ